MCNSRLLSIFLLLTLLIGLFETAVAEPVVIKVKSGDTLIQLCEKYLDNSRDWPHIAKINRLTNPHQIFPSEYLIVPVDFLKGIPVHGKITHLQGKVDILTSVSQNKWLPLSLNDLVEQGQKIRTHSKSSTEISYPDGVSLFLRENTVVQIVKSREKSKTNKAYDFFLDIGRSKSKIRKATGKTNRFQIRTPTAVASSRGTTYRVNVDEKTNTRMEVLEGSINVNTGKQILQVDTGYGAMVSKDQKKNSVVKLLPPSKPLNLLTLYKSMPLRFSFIPVEGAKGFRVFLTRDKELQHVVKEKLIKPDEPFEIVSVEDGIYYLACCSVDALGIEGVFSEPVAIKVRINPLPPFVQSPQNNANIKDIFCSLNWLQVSDAETYHIQIAEDKDFSTIVLEDKKMTSTTFTTKQLPYKTYYYRISSLTSDGYEGVWSDTGTFTLVPPPPTPIAEKPRITENEIQLRWQNVGQGIIYRFQLSKTPDFLKPMLDQQITEPQIIITRPEKAAIYYSRIQAIDTDGYTSNFSTPQSFEVENELSWLDGGVIITSIIAFLLIF